MVLSLEFAQDAGEVEEGPSNPTWTVPSDFPEVKYELFPNIAKVK